jgi:Domain of unknown function (DUF5664)
MAIGDVNSSERGSGARFNDNKPDFSLIPLVTLEDEARVWEYGARKYAKNNWMKGQAWSVPLACALRHLAAWQSGETVDAESGVSHLAHAICNLRMLTLYATTYPEGDDRPTKWLRPDLDKRNMAVVFNDMLGQPRGDWIEKLDPKVRQSEMPTVPDAITHAFIAQCEKGDS